MDAVQEKPTIKGKYVAITGILAFYKRQDALDQIEACGEYLYSIDIKDSGETGRKAADALIRLIKIGRAHV